MNTSNTRATSYTLGACLLALVIGALAGSLYSSKPAEIHTRIPDAAAESTAARPALTAEPGTSMINESAIHEIQAATGTRRWLLLLSMAEKATAADMPELIRSVGDDSAAINILAVRWAELDPKHMFSTLCADSFSAEGAPGALARGYELGSVLIEEWSKNDLAGAVKALTDAPNFFHRRNYRMMLVNSVMKLDVEHGLHLIKDWNTRTYYPDMKKITEWAARDPRHAAETVLGVGSGFVSEMLREVGKAWAQTDPEGALRFATTLDPALRDSLAGPAIGQWAEKNISAAAAFVTAQPDLLFSTALVHGLVATWSKTDPKAALAWSQENLRGVARTVSISNLFSSVGEKSLTTASQLVADMEPGAAQNRACASIFRTWFNKGASERTAALEWLASLPDAAARHSALELVQSKWVSEDPDGVREFLAGPYGDLAPNSMTDHVARSQASKNPEAAMQWASTLPGARATNARMAVLENWLSIRPEGAAAYVRELPAGSERQQAVRTVSQRLVEHSPQQAAEWYRTLPIGDQQIAMQMFQQSLLDDDHRKLLDRALKR